MSITEQGRKGEMLARKFLWRQKIDNLFQPDWMVVKGGRYYVIEVKCKEIFTAPPFDGQGLDIRQVHARMKLYKDTGIRCLFLVFCLNDATIRWAWLDELEQTQYHDTRNGIRIYNINNFHEGGVFGPSPIKDVAS